LGRGINAIFFASRTGGARVSPAGGKSPVGRGIADTQDEPGRNIKLKWLPKAKDAVTRIAGDVANVVRNESLIQPIVRAHAWLYSLRERAYDSIEQLAEANGLHPKVIRQNLRLAFLSPAVTAAILEGAQPAELSLARIPTLLPLSWKHHRFLLE
jgi:site-specific DNA recombinase